jgi:site-specific recombinase XerC
MACCWLEAGGSLAALQEILGHASIVTTQVYARLGEAHVRAEAAKVFEKGDQRHPTRHPESRDTAGENEVTCPARKSLGAA